MPPVVYICLAFLILGAMVALAIGVRIYRAARYLLHLVMAFCFFVLAALFFFTGIYMAVEIVRRL